MIPAIWLLRAKRWVQNPPSPWRIKLVFGVIAICAAIWAVEYFGFWPESLKADMPRRVPRF